MSRRGSYPHPVLDDSDDVSSDIEVLNCTVSPTQEDIEISYELRTDDPDLIDLLDDGIACHSLRWRCSSTISTGEMNPVVERRNGNRLALKAWLDQHLVKGKVDADIRILALRSVEGFRWKRQHADYGTATFDLKNGDILADGGSITFSANKLYDPLDPPVGSCFRFVRSTTMRKRIAVSFYGDEYVDVQISATTFDQFKQFGHRPDLQIALVVLPALMETLRFMKENRADEPLESKAWFRTIEMLAKTYGGWEISPLDLAQKILNSPIDRAVEVGFAAEED